MDFTHTSVMLGRTIEALAPVKGGLYVDCTSGGGGHTGELLKRVGPEGAVLGIDQDPDAVEYLTETLGAEYPNFIIRRSNFARIEDVLRDVGWEAVDGMVLDLGISSHQLEESGRGFSFGQNEPLDMRMNPDVQTTAREIVNRMPESKLADLIFLYGEERASRRVARAIVWARKKKPVETSSELADIVRKALYKPGRRPRIDPATRTFQALRLAVNRELESLETFLAVAPGFLKIGGRLAVISFHSLEDRLVKNAMIRGKKPEPDQAGKPAIMALHKKPLLPSEEEIEMNPRARSAKLRVGERI